MKVIIFLLLILSAFWAKADKENKDTDGTVNVYMEDLDYMRSTEIQTTIRPSCLLSVDMIDDKQFKITHDGSCKPFAEYLDKHGVIYGKRINHLWINGDMLK